MDTRCKDLRPQQQQQQQHSCFFQHSTQYCYAPIQCLSPVMAISSRSNAEHVYAVCRVATIGLGLQLLYTTSADNSRCRHRDSKWLPACRKYQATRKALSCHLYHVLTLRVRCIPTEQDALNADALNMPVGSPSHFKREYIN